VSLNYSLRIQGDNQFRFWTSLLAFAVSAIFVAQDDVSKMLLLILLFVGYTACFGLGHFLSKTRYLSHVLHYVLHTGDILYVTGVIYLTGGSQSPLFLMYIVFLGLNLYNRSLADFVFGFVLSLLLYGGILYREVLGNEISYFKMAGLLCFISILTGFTYVLLFLITRQEKFQKKLVSRAKTLAEVANTLSGSLAHSKNWIKRVTSLIEAEIHDDGLKCRISIHKGNLQFLPPIGGRKEISIPIMVGECVFGSMIVTHEAEKPLSPTDQDFFSSIAVSLGLTLHRAKLWDEINEKLAKENAPPLAESNLVGMGNLSSQGSEPLSIPNPGKVIEVVPTDA